jgi:hypothetical protein
MNALSNPVQTQSDTIFGGSGRASGTGASGDWSNPYNSVTTTTKNGSLTGTYTDLAPIPVGSNLNPGVSNAPAIRPSTAPSTYSPTGTNTTTTPYGTSILGNGSNAQVGQPYFDLQGNYIVPKQAFSGSSGASNQQLSFTPAPTGTTGNTGGTSAYTGTLGGTGGLGSTGVYSQEDQNSKNKKPGVNGQDISLGGQQAQGNSGFLSSLLGGLASSPLAGFINPLLPGIANASSLLGGIFGTPHAPINVQPTQQTTMTAGPVPNSVNAGDLVASAGKTNPVTSLPQASSPSDLTHTNINLNNAYKQNLDKINQANPTPQNPVQNTPEQDAFLKQVADQGKDPYGIQAAMDEYKAQNTQLTALHTSQIDVMKKIQAINDTYQGAIDEIKNNPNLPKSLGVRRLEAINTSQKNVLQGFTNQLQILQQQISDQNETVNRAFNIVTNSQAQQEKAKNYALNTMQLMISSGAIGGFNSQDIATFSQTLGIPTSAIQAMKDHANQPDLQTGIGGSADTGYFSYAIDKKTGNVVSKTQLTGGQNGNAGNVAADPTATNLYQQLKTRSISFASLPADQKKLALSAFAARGETIPRELTSAEKTAQQSAISGLNAVDQIKTMFQQGNLPLTSDAILGDSVFGRMAGNSQYTTLKKEAADVVTRIRTGAALNESEVSFYQGLLPKLGDSTADIQLKLNQLTGFYLGMSGLPVTVTDPQGGSYQFDDLYNSQQRLGLRKAISSGYQLSY